jgi:hypothetical protein
MATFKDFNISTLKTLIKQYNLHLIIKNYSNLSKEKMIKKIEEHLYYDDFNKIALKPIAIRKLTDFLSKLKPIKLQPKIKPKKKKIESEIDTSNIKMKDVIKKVNNIITENNINIKNLSKKEEKKIIKEAIKEVKEEVKQDIDHNENPFNYKNLNDAELSRVKRLLLEPFMTYFKQYYKPNKDNSQLIVNTFDDTVPVQYQVILQNDINRLIKKEEERFKKLNKN